MSQHDYNIANGGGAAVRADINNALLAILSQNSGATAPTTTKPFMLWYDTANGVIKQRNAADNAWVTGPQVDASGNVGIGTSSPNVLGANAENAILTLKGKAATRGGILELGNYGTTGNGQTLGLTRYFDGSTENASIEVARASSTSTAYMAFSTNGGSGNTERARIDSSGNLLVGIGSTFTSAFLQIQNTPGVKTAYAAKAQVTTGSTLFELHNPNGLVGQIQTNGSATSYVTSSDYRLKENIAPMTGALSVVQQLKPCTYNWKVDGSNGQGFIAHELAEVVPECVVGEKDAVDADGNPQYQGIDTSFLVATLTAAIQEQQAIITSLTDRIAALENANV